MEIDLIKDHGFDSSFDNSSQNILQKSYELNVLTKYEKSSQKPDSSVHSIQNFDLKKNNDYDINKFFFSDSYSLSDEEAISESLKLSEETNQSSDEISNEAEDTSCVLIQDCINPIADSGTEIVNSQGSKVNIEIEEDNNDSIQNGASSIKKYESEDVVTKKYSRKESQFRRNSGKSYLSRSGKIVEERVLRKLSKCRKLCQNIISYEDQKSIYESYWSNGTYKARCDFVQNLITVNTTKIHRSKSKNQKLRKYTVIYHLNKGSKQVEVCKKCFLDTLGEKKAFILVMVEKIWLRMDESIAVDGRGRHEPKNKTPPAKIQEVNDHIAKLAAQEIHYSLLDTSEEYLPAAMSVASMYKLYKEEVTDPVSLKVYRGVFAKTGLKFKHPEIATSAPSVGSMKSS